MESFRPPAPLRLDSSNLEDEWTSFEKKFNWFLLAIGADRKPDATKLAMLLTTVGDDAVRIFEAFTYAEGELPINSTSSYGSSRNTARRYTTSFMNVFCSGNMHTLHRRQVRLSINMLHVTTRQRHLAKTCNFMEEDNMIRDHIVFT